MTREAAFVLAGYFEDAISLSSTKMEQLATKLGATTIHCFAGITTDTLSMNGQETTGRAWFAVRPEDLTAAAEGKTPDLKKYKPEMTAAADYVIKRIGNAPNPVVIGFSQGAMIAEAIYYRSEGRIPCISIQGASVDFMANPEANYAERMHIFQRPETPESYHSNHGFQSRNLLGAGEHAITDKDIERIVDTLKASELTTKPVAQWRAGQLDSKINRNPGMGA